MYKTINNLIYYKALKKAAPLIIICRGGNNDFYLWDKKRLNKVLNYPGFNTVAFDYPSNDKYGGKPDLDFIKRIPALLKKAGVNFTSIGVFGISRGGLMAYQLLRDVKWVKACVIKAAPTDMRALLNQRLDLKDYLKTKFTFNKKELDNRSPILWANKITIPTLVMHGMNDIKVPFSHALFLTEKIGFFNGDHYLKDYPIKKLALDWFKKYL